MLDIDLKTGRSQSDTMPSTLRVNKVKLKHGRSAMSQGQAAMSNRQTKLVTAWMKKRTLDAFGSATDLEVLMRKRRSDSFVDLNSMDGLRSAYDKALDRAGRLNHALSRSQMERDENQFLFREAVNLGEQLRSQNLILEEKIEEQLDTESFLQRELKSLKEANRILNEEIDDMRLAETKAAKVQEALSKSNAELKLQTKLINRIKDDHELAKSSWDVDVKEEFERLKQELTKETAARVKAEEDLREAELKLEWAERQVEQLNQNVDDLKEKFESETSRLGEEVLNLCTEKARWDKFYDTLLMENKALEMQLNQFSEAPSGQLSGVGEVNEQLDMGQAATSKFAGPSLADQIEFATYRDSFASGNGTSEADTELENDFNEKYANPLDASAAPHLAEVFRSYLYITATAVKLHFPDLDSVLLSSLIEHVQSSPFYLYYDLMMAFMREVKQEKALEDVKKENSNLPPARIEQSSWLERFRRLKQKTTKPNNESARSSLLKPRSSFKYQDALVASEDFAKSKHVSTRIRI